MNSTPPISFLPLQALQSLVETLPPPDWLVEEGQNRLVLLLNHVLMQEPQAQDRLRRQSGRTARLVWGANVWTLRATPAGLVERVAPAPGSAPADLTMTLTETRWAALAQTLAAGQRPAVNIEGDVQLAAEVGWLVENLRWDVEEDLARWLGDPAAHTLCSAVRGAMAVLKAWVGRQSASPGSGNGTAAP